jgi:DNA-directed RNA polymerase subunit RPC12/RpoP
MEKESKCFSCGIKLEETLTAIQCSDCIAKRETTAVQHKATSMRGGPTPLNLEAIQRNSGGTKSSISKQEAGKGLFKQYFPG